MKLAADIVEHKGPGQRRNRNRLAFLAVDQVALEVIQNVVRKTLAWASNVRDARGILQLPPAQEDDAKKKLAEQETAALNAVRRGWRHLLTHYGTSRWPPRAYGPRWCVFRPGRPCAPNGLRPLLRALHAPTHYGMTRHSDLRMDLRRLRLIRVRCNCAAKLRAQSSTERGQFPDAGSL
jgi:hypothetical protein